MRDWNLKDNPVNGSVLNIPCPRYRASFEPGETAPRRIRVCSLTGKGDSASVRFMTPIFDRQHPFGVSVEIPPETWQPAGSRRGWHFFHSGDVHLGLWSSLPATWLAQSFDGKPLQPPWRELWTFGTDHLWAGRFSRTADSAADGLEAFIANCLADALPRPGYRGGTLFDSDTLLSGGIE